MVGDTITDRVQGNIITRGFLPRVVLVVVVYLRCQRMWLQGEGMPITSPTPRLLYRCPKWVPPSLATTMNRLDQKRTSPLEDVNTDVIGRLVYEIPPPPTPPAPLVFLLLLLQVWHPHPRISSLPRTPSPPRHPRPILLRFQSK